MPLSHAAPTRRDHWTSSRMPPLRRTALARCASVVTPLLVVAATAAWYPATGSADSLTTGLRYDIQMTSTSTQIQNGQPTASSNTALAHVEIANGKVRIDIADGEFAAVAGTGDFLLYKDTSQTATLVKPSLNEYMQMNVQKFGAQLTGIVNAFGGGMGVHASSVKLNFASLGPGDKVGPFSTAKYRITQDYVLTVSFLGADQGKGVAMHSTTDYWYAPELTMIVNPFAQFIQETAWLGPTYGQQLSALEAKLPKGVPVKSILTDVATDSVGSKTTTTVTWELSNFVRADIPDAAFQIPAGYSQATTGTGVMQPLTSGLTNGASALQGGGPVTSTSALQTLIKAGQNANGQAGGMPAGMGMPSGAGSNGGANGSTAGAPTTSWSGNGTSTGASGSSPWSAATAGQNVGATAPATSGQDTTHKGHPQ